MSIVLVHGVPMTSALWRPMMDVVDRDDVVALDLPGFKEPPPEGWVATKEAYVHWLIGRLEEEYQRGGPVHLVGHDWGCLLSLRAASLWPDLLRSVAAGNGPIDPHWPLHSLWRVWNQAGAGERWMDELDTSGLVTALAANAGLPEEVAREVSWQHPWNRQVTLSLYRSAKNVGREWVDDLARIVIPSMIIWGQLDLIVPIEFGRRMAARMGAQVVTLDAHHFWPAERPLDAAEALQQHWQRAEAIPTTILHQTVPEWFTEDS